MDNTKTSNVSCNTVHIRWFDGHFEKIDANADSIRFGSDNLVFKALSELIIRVVPLRSVRWFSTSIESHQNPNINRGNNLSKKFYVIKVKWCDDYTEEFKASEYRHGSDLLWMRLDTGENRHVPLRSVRHFTVCEVLDVDANSFSSYDHVNYKNF